VITWPFISLPFFIMASPHHLHLSPAGAMLVIRSDHHHRTLLHHHVIGLRRKVKSRSQKASESQGMVSAIPIEMASAKTANE
jgi:hypothetical protein